MGRLADCNDLLVGCRLGSFYEIVDFYETVKTALNIFFFTLLVHFTEL